MHEQQQRRGRRQSDRRKIADRVVRQVADQLRAARKRREREEQRVSVGLGLGDEIGADLVAKAQADGYTLLFAFSSLSSSAKLISHLPYDPVGDFAPVALATTSPLLLFVHPSVPATDLKEFIAYAKANPGKINFGSAGTGSVAHVTGELFKMMAGIQMQHVPYRGAPLALADLLSGQVQVMFDNLPSSIEHIRTGRLRALGVSTPARLAILPDVPPIGDTLPGFETSAFAGIGAPKGTPRDIVEKLNRAINTGLADPKLQARIVDLGGVPMPMTPAEFGAFLAAETDKWAKVIRAANIKVQ